MAGLAKAWQDRLESLTTATRQQVESTAAYKAFDPGVLEAKTKLDAARASHDGVIEASAAYGAARKPQIEMESAAIHGDKGIQRAKAIADEAQAHSAYAIALQSYKDQSSAIANAQREKELATPLRGIGNHSIGTLEQPVEVVQILDEKSFIGMYAGTDMIVRGVSTTGMVDGRYFNLKTPIQVTGTESYNTVLGAKRTVFTVVPASAEPGK